MSGWQRAEKDQLTHTHTCTHTRTCTPFTSHREPNVNSLEGWKKQEGEGGRGKKKLWWWQGEGQSAIINVATTSWLARLMWRSASSRAGRYDRAPPSAAWTAWQCCQPAGQLGCSLWVENISRAELWKWLELGSSYPWECLDRWLLGCWCCSGRYECGT